ncbi:hypothetical protein [Nocardioides ultimimeridianus]
MTAALALALSASACGGSARPQAGPSDSSSPTVAPYLTAVPSGVSLTTPGTTLKLGEHAVIAWHPKVSETAVLDVQVTRIERTTYDKSFQGWKVSPTLAATTPYFARAVVTNVSDAPLDKIVVPIWAEEDSGTLVATQPFQKRVFEPCHPYVTPESFAPGARIDMCFVFAISPGQDLRSVTFRPYDDSNEPLESITWKGHISSKVQPPVTKKKHTKAKRKPTQKATKQ